MKRTLLMAVAVVVAVAGVVGCGSDAPEPASPDPGVARLAVWERLPPQPRYIEGSVAFLRIESVESGELLADGRVTGAGERGRAPLFAQEVAPGDYRVASHQRPCNGNCSLLDPPADRCETTIRVDAAVRATIVLAQEGGCEIRVAPGA